MCCRQTRGVARPNFLSVSYDISGVSKLKSGTHTNNCKSVRSDCTVQTFRWDTFWYEFKCRERDMIISKTTYWRLNFEPLSVLATTPSHNFDKRAQQHCSNSRDTHLSPNDNTIHNDELLPIDTILSTISIHEPTSRRFANDIQI